MNTVLSTQLLIKAVEVRVLGKTVVIGNKVCETKDLFSPHPQLMTVNLNPSGSLKLNIVITWKWVEFLRQVALDDMALHTRGIAYIRLVSIYVVIVS